MEVWNTCIRKWITFSFTPFSIVFQTCQEHERALCSKALFKVEKMSAEAGLETETARSAG